MSYWKGVLTGVVVVVVLAATSVQVAGAPLGSVASAPGPEPGGSATGALSTGESSVTTGTDASAGAFDPVSSDVRSVTGSVARTGSTADPAGPVRTAAVAGRGVSVADSRSGATIQVDRTLYRTPGDRENVTVETTVTLPDGVASFTADIASSLSRYQYRVTSTTGFDHDESAGTLTLNSSRGETTTGSFTFDVGVTETDQYDDGRVDTTETADWALVEDDQYNLRSVYSYFTEPDVAETTTVSGDGYATERFAFLGPVDTYRRTANGQQFTLVVSRSASPTRSPDRILASLAFASGLDVGDRDSVVTGFVVPSPIEDGGRGSGNVFWVNEGSTDSIVAHEYVHTRQAWVDLDADVSIGDSVEWFTEASADYYQGYLAWTAGNLSASEFRSYVSTDRYADRVLQDGDSVSVELKNYYKGRRVLAALDLRIRDRTGGESTLTDVFAEVNAIRGEAIDYVDLRSAVVDRTDEATGTWLDKYVTTTAVPSIPANIEAAYAADGSNGAPTADAGGSRTVAAGATVTLDGGGSSDPDGDALTYTWQQVGGPSVSLSAAGTASRTFTAPVVSSETDLTFQLGVSDGTASDTDTVVVTVRPDNDPPVAEAGTNLTVAPGGTVRLDGSGSTDPNGDTLSYGWQQVGGPSVILVDSGTASPTLRAPTVSSEVDLVFELEASDGVATDTDTVVVTVRPESDDSGGQHESGVSRQVFDAVAGSDGSLERSDVLAMVQGYLQNGSVDSVALSRADVLALVRYYVGA